MRRTTVRRIQRILLTVCFVALLGIGLLAAQAFGLGMPRLEDLAPEGLLGAAYGKQVALISGHDGSDSGAVCMSEDGAVSLREVDVNADIATRVASRLRRAGADVLVLQEFDDRLEGLQMDVLLSLHADSCIDASGYKAAHHANSPIAATEQLLLGCIDQQYAAATGLPPHPNTVTHNMTRYHAFNRIDVTTPAVILEMGFLGGDRNTLTRRQNSVATGIADSIICFLEEQSEDRAS